MIPPRSAPSVSPSAAYPSSAARETSASGVHAPSQNENAEWQRSSTYPMTPLPFTPAALSSSSHGEPILVQSTPSRGQRCAHPRRRKPVREIEPPPPAMRHGPALRSSG